MKNRIIVMLSLLTIMPMVAEEKGENPSVTQANSPQDVSTANNNNNTSIKNPENEVTLADDSAKGSIVKGAGQAIDSGIMSLPYYLGYGVSGIASGLKTVGKYTVALPFRMAGWGIDGMFGEGTTQGMWNKTGTCLKGSVAVALGYGAYKGLNRFAKWFAISDIQDAFKNAGEKNALGDLDLLHFEKKKYSSLTDFYVKLKATLKDRFERTDILSYIKNPVKEYVKINLVCDEIEELVKKALKSNNNLDIASICAIARKNCTAGYVGRIHILNGYCQEALELYGELVFAVEKSKVNVPKVEYNLQEKEALNIKEKSHHEEIIALINDRTSKK